ncbi:tRNA pseudouridylate synthase [Dictyostelium discoideum AX4]|uniref:tRNA pseudouridylate synthase n=1 Tax=Dictyostelium discoideum TaxID=44689 RepID=Q54I97_DICDI|nr:tRNA pseudouridylate synthase [Dictyostelium discoideum AX4]EAL62978.1 tRNA pseudouridylate synthase [Dictyostelium discoideum AX4]|eukprot:XP_636482.1 tRNA pseudouridylate synthase [Dictyostelium discoideum AX4]
MEKETINSSPKKTTTTTTQKLNDKEYLSTLSKDELINLIVQENEKKQQQSKNIFKNNGVENTEGKKKKKNRNKQSNINFDKCYKRHVAFKLSYVGWPFFGFAAQDCSEETIENYLIKAFLKTSLIPDIKTANYFKSGRTDKGVSAYGQVISLYVRSNLKEGEGIIPPKDQSGGPISNRTKSNKTELTKNNDNEKARKGNKKSIEDDEELPYIKMLNGVLPPEIRILAWAPVPFHFNARFSTLSRTYKYFFNPNGLDLNLMKEASKLYLGEHNYINFCKIDVNVKSFMRVILQFDIEKVENSELYVATIKGFAFLWHQIRCMMAVLFLIGQKKANISLITQLLDTNKTITKPPYEMASEVPLVLFDCGYDDIDFIYESSVQEKTVESMFGVYNDYLIKTEVNRLIRSTLKNTEPTTTSKIPQPITNITNPITSPTLSTTSTSTSTSTTTTTTTETNEINSINIGEKRKHSIAESEKELEEEGNEHKHKHNKN